MDAMLQCDLKLTEDPYPDDASPNGDIWAEYNLHIRTANSHISLLVWQWDVTPFAEWYVEHHSAICSDSPVVAGQRTQPGESLAVMLDRLRKQDFDDEEAEYQWYDSIWQYYRRHGLTFALPGARIPDIILGCNHGSGEISLSAAASAKVDYGSNPLPMGTKVLLGQWAYSFDMSSFLSHVQASLQTILSQYLASSNDISRQNKVQNILQQLMETHNYTCCS